MDIKQYYCRSWSGARGGNTFTWQLFWWTCTPVWGHKTSYCNCKVAWCWMPRPWPRVSNLYKFKTDYFSRAWEESTHFSCSQFNYIQRKAHLVWEHASYLLLNRNTLSTVLYFYWPLILKSLLQRNSGRDSTVGIATHHRLDGPGIESWWVPDFPHQSRLSLGPLSLFYNRYSVIPGGKAA